MAENIRIITTGGTIDKVYFDALSDYQVGEPTIGQILEEAHVEVNYTVQKVCKKDSLDLTDEDREAVAEAVRAAKEKRVLITHGTDTMIKTAQYLKSIPGKTIVFTGAMNPTRIRNSDAFFNVGCAIIAVQTLAPGIYIVMNGQIHNPDKVQKNRSHSRFESV
ncbi:MAG: asparaginase [Proteobacteria bacterium]|nr:MAG: asparaginase [Pseudomonadota bacterium]